LAKENCFETGVPQFGVATPLGEGLTEGEFLEVKFGDVNCFLVANETYFERVMSEFLLRRFLKVGTRGL
jgi:hypothetical protein